MWRAAFCVLSKTRALRSSHMDRNVSMMKELAFLLSALERCPTTLGHQSGKVLCAVGAVMLKPT
jgi:hypothetical protein